MSKGRRSRPIIITISDLLFGDPSSNGLYNATGSPCPSTQGTNWTLLGRDQNRAPEIPLGGILRHPVGASPRAHHKALALTDLVLTSTRLMDVLGCQGFLNIPNFRSTPTDQLTANNSPTGSSCLQVNQHQPKRCKYDQVCRYAPPVT